MKKVQLSESEVSKDPLLLISIFIRVAYAQGFDIDWIEAVFTEAIADNCVNFWNVMIKYIEIIPERSAS